MRPFHPNHFLKTLWRMRPISAALIVLAIALPWYVLVGLQTDGQWLRKFLFAEHLGRATVAQENHGGGFWYYPIAVLLGFFPWSVFIVPTIVGVDRQITRKHHWSMSYTLLLCWVGVQVGIFSLAQTKLPSYVTPCYPALALLTGAFLYRFAAHRSFSPASLNKLAFVVLGISGVLITAGLFIVGTRFLNGNSLVASFGLFPIAASGIAIWLVSRKQYRGAATVCCSMAVLFSTGLFGVASVIVDRQQTSHVVLDKVASSPQAVPVASYRCLESSWVFYGGKPIRELSPKQIKMDSENDVSWKENPNRWPTPEQFLKEFPRALVITTSQALDELRQRLPEHYRVIEQTRYFMRDKEIVLLGPKNYAALAEQNETIQR